MEPTREFMIIQLGLLGFGVQLLIVQDGRGGKLKGEPWKFSAAAQKPFGNRFWDGEIQIWPIDFAAIIKRIRSWVKGFANL